MEIHFIGIGGIGVSALARYFLAKDHRVSGSDLSFSEITKDLENKGAKVFIGPHKAKNLDPQAKGVVFSVAAKSANPELKKAKKLGIKTQTYPQALGELTKKHWTIAVSGAHGKGTTTAMISLILIKAGLDPTVIIGTNLREFNNANCRIGKSRYLVIEADEYQRAFLNYWPKMIVVTNIDKEHLDCYHDLDDIVNSFKEFIGHLPKNGFLIANQDDPNIKYSAFGTAVQNVVYFSLEQKEVKRLRRILKIPGEHNVLNALAALKAARALKIPDKISFLALSQYEGAWRRFEIVKTKPCIVISDYAHHPTEIKATIEGARKRFKNKKIWAVFQPHQYQRTLYLFKEFLTAFGGANELILTEIYSVPGREKKDIIKKVSGEKLARAIQKQGKKVHFVKDYQQIPNFLKKQLRPGEVILVMGAGPIYKIVEKLI